MSQRNPDIERNPDSESLYALTIRRDSTDPHWFRAAETPEHAVEMLNNKFSFEIPPFGEKVERGDYLDDERGDLAGWFTEGNGRVKPFPVTYYLVWWPKQGRYNRYNIELRWQVDRVRSESDELFIQE